MNTLNTNVPDKLTIAKVLRLHEAGGVLHSEPAYPTKDLLEDTPEAQNWRRCGMISTRLKSP